MNKLAMYAVYGAGLGFVMHTVVDKYINRV